MKPRLFHTKLFSLLTFLIVSFIVIAVSCRKTDMTSTDQSAVSAPTDVSDAQLKTTNFAFQMEILDEMDFDEGSTVGTGCKTVTYDPSKNVYPHTATITFDNCTTCTGDVLNGTKIAQFYIDPNLANPGDLIEEVTYSDFTLNNEPLTGDVKFYFVSNSPLTLHIVTARTSTISGKFGISRTFNGDLYRTQIAGGSTQDKSDDVYSLTGTVSGTVTFHDKTAANYTTVVDSEDPVVKAFNCCWRSSGTVTSTVNVDFKNVQTTITLVLDYGNGDCDDQAMLSINGRQPHTVTLPLRF